MVRVALGQLDLTVGDIDGNTARAIETIKRAADAQAQIVALPELAITGYPPEDLVLKRSFVQANIEAVGKVAAATHDVMAVVGFVDPGGDGLLHNAAAICHEGKVVATYHKHLLPNYGVFDEERYFEPGSDHVLLDTPQGVVGICICEDLWSPTGPAISQGDAGAQLVLNINASPFHKNKLEERTDLLAERARRARAAIAYVNMVGGQDELVFDGGSLVVDADGKLIARFPQFVEHFGIIDVPMGEVHGHGSPSMRRVTLALPDAHGESTSECADQLDDSREVYDALTLALCDYVVKNSFEKVVIGLSGGIDSTLTAAIAVDALGSENVLGVAMPSEFSTSHSIQDAKALATNLDIEMLEIPIAPIYRAYIDVLRDSFAQSEAGLAEENLQARIRGNLLMAISNRYGHLVIATGNKSEMACGYATLYGDMAGGFALLKDVFKTEVYDLSRYRNSVSPVIPENVLTKAPSAELRHDQKDTDSLPAYEVLDPILEGYIERDEGIAELADAGHDRAMVEKVVALVDRAEYKRRQAPPGPKVTTKAFGRDRRLPITNRWREGARSHLPERSVGQDPTD